ncbi:hypothetical protein HOP50_16g77410 [Chloropicon primus]|nr:hypothetical protein HOP50_16g77410 [Chloropicon primus]
MRGRALAGGGKSLRGGHGAARKASRLPRARGGVILRNLSAVAAVVFLITLFWMTVSSSTRLPHTRTVTDAAATATGVSGGSSSSSCESLSRRDWRCGCKKFGNSSERIDYASSLRMTHEEAKGDAIPKLVHFVSRIYLEDSREATSRGGSASEWCGDVPCKYLDYMEKYLDKLDGFEFQLHCREQIEGLLASLSPPLLQIYGVLRRGIQRADFARYVLLYYFGGLYTDLDVEPKVDFGSRLLSHAGGDSIARSSAGPRVILAVESSLNSTYNTEKMEALGEECAARGNDPVMSRVCKSCSRAIENRSYADLMGCVHPIRKGRPEQRTRIANYWMMSSPKHAFWVDTLELLQRRSELEVRDQYDVLYITGPDVVSEVYSLYEEQEEVLARGFG